MLQEWEVSLRQGQAIPHWAFCPNRVQLANLGTLRHTHGPDEFEIWIFPQPGETLPNGTAHEFEPRGYGVAGIGESSMASGHADNLAVRAARRNPG